MGSAKDPMILVFSADDVCRLTRLSQRQLAYWDKTGFFAPEFAGPQGRPFARVYSFRDVVGLRTISTLLHERVPTSELRKVGKWLAEQEEEWSDTPWASLTFYVGGRHVFFEDPKLGARRAGAPPQQTAFPIEMRRIAHTVRQEAAQLRTRTPAEIGQVSQRRNVVHNMPVVAGTRIPTSAIWEFHRAGYANKDIIREYPRLTPDDVDAAIAFEEERRLKKQAS